MHVQKSFDMMFDASRVYVYWSIYYNDRNLKKTVSVVRAVMAECQNDSTLNEELMVKTKAYCIFSKQGSGRVLLWLLMASNH